MSRPFSMRLDDDVYEGLKAIHTLTGKSMALLLNQAGRQFIAETAADDSFGETVMAGVRMKEEALQVIKEWAANR